MNKGDFKGQNNSIGESEVDNKVITVGSSQGHRALVIAVVVVLLGVVYYFYFRPSHKENQELVDKKEIKIDMHELKNKLEKVPDEVPAPERIMVNPLPPLPEIVMPQHIPEVKTEVKKTATTEKKEVKTQKEEPKKTVETKSNLPPLLTKKSVSYDPAVPLSPLVSNRYPETRRKGQMVAYTGSSNNKSSDRLSNTTVEQRKITRMSDFNYMIGQGKIIDAILETSINSDMTGIIRAVVSRDVYAEKGDIVLVPRGSRLIGNCSFDSNIVKSRINISWNRIILPSGGDVVISSPGTDELGIPGVTGIVDNKVMHKLFSSIMVTGVSIGAAIVSQKASILTSGTTAVQMISGIIANTIDISSINDILGLPDDVELKLKSQAVKRLQGAKTESSLMSFFRDEVKRAVDKLKPKPQDWDPKKVNEITIESIKNVLRAQGGPSVYENIVQNSIKDFAQDMRETINNNVDTKPTVYVNQGTALKVFVNQDIIFPSCT